MRTLIITHHRLDKPGGGSYATSAFVNAIAEISDEAVLLYPYSEQQPAFISKKVTKIPVRNDKHVIRKYLDLLLGRIHRYSETIGQLNEKFDIVVFDTSMVSYRLIDYFKKKGAKTICIHHNFQAEYYRDNSSNFMIKMPTLFWCKRFEGQAVRKCDLNVVLTDSDKELLIGAYDGNPKKFFKVGVFEYSKDQHKGKRGKRVRNRETTFAITGNLSAKQSEDSIVSWMKSYYPILCDLVPESRLIIAGRNPSDKILSICSGQRNVEIIPNPESMDDILQRSDIYICPTFLGGGLKLRIMDGLKNDMPVITHAVSARGYEDFKERGYLWSYDNKENFKSGLRNLMDHLPLEHEISNYFYSVLSYSAGLDRMRKIIGQLGLRN